MGDKSWQNAGSGRHSNQQRVVTVLTDLPLQLTVAPRAHPQGTGVVEQACIWPRDPVAGQHNNVPGVTRPLDCLERLTGWESFCNSESQGSLIWTKPLHFHFPFEMENTLCSSASSRFFRIEGVSLSLLLFISEHKWRHVVMGVWEGIAGCCWRIRKVDPTVTVVLALLCSLWCFLLCSGQFLGSTCFLWLCQAPAF